MANLITIVLCVSVFIIVFTVPKLIERFNRYLFYRKSRFFDFSNLASSDFSIYDFFSQAAPKCSFDIYSVVSKGNRFVFDVSLFVFGGSIGFDYRQTMFVLKEDSFSSLLQSDGFIYLVAKRSPGILHSVKDSEPIAGAKNLYIYNSYINNITDEIVNSKFSIFLNGKMILFFIPGKRVNPKNFDKYFDEVLLLVEGLKSAVAIKE